MLGSGAWPRRRSWSALPGRSSCSSRSTSTCAAMIAGGSTASCSIVPPSRAAPRPRAMTNGARAANLCIGPGRADLVVAACAISTRPAGVARGHAAGRRSRPARGDPPGSDGPDPRDRRCMSSRGHRVGRALADAGWTPDATYVGPARGARVRVRGKGSRTGSTRWLDGDLNDPLVRAAAGGLPHARLRSSWKSIAGSGWPAGPYRGRPRQRAGQLTQVAAARGCRAIGIDRRRSRRLPARPGRRRRVRRGDAPACARRPADRRRWC